MCVYETNWHSSFKQSPRRSTDIAKNATVNRRDSQAWWRYVEYHHSGAKDHQVSLKFGHAVIHCQQLMYKDFPHFSKHECNNQEWLSERAIIAQRNTGMDEMNA